MIQQTVFPEKVLRSLPRPGETDHEYPVKAYIRLFYPGTSWNYWILEYDRTSVLFGYLEDPFNPEDSGFRTYTFSALLEQESPNGLPLERDVLFKPRELHLVAKSLFDGKGWEEASKDHRKKCQNCGQRLRGAVGNYCANEGQCYREFQEK